MAAVITVPAVDVPVVTLARICRMKKNRNGIFVRREIDALVWDPTELNRLQDALSDAYAVILAALKRRKADQTECPGGQNEDQT